MTVDEQERTESPRSKRRMILDAAIDNFGGVGFEHTKWATIADEVGIGQTALYHYFESKVHCLLTIMSTELERSLERTRTVTGMLMFTPSSQLTMKVFGLYSEDHDGASAQGQLSAYEVRSNNGVVNIPALSGNTAGKIIIPGLSNCTVQTQSNSTTNQRLDGVNVFLLGK